MLWLSYGIPCETSLSQFEIKHPWEGALVNALSVSPMAAKLKRKGTWWMSSCSYPYGEGAGFVTKQ